MRYYWLRIRKALRSRVILIALLAVATTLVFEYSNNRQIENIRQHRYITNIREKAKSFWNKDQNLGWPPPVKEIRKGLEGKPSYVKHNHTEDDIELLYYMMDTPLYSDDDLSDDARDNVLRDNELIYEEVLNEKISEPRVNHLVRADDPEYEHQNATILALVRNSETEAMLQSIRDMEEKFNAKFRYPYTFLNNEDFTDEFKSAVAKILPGDREVRWGKIPSEDWDKPRDVPMSFVEQGGKEMEEKGVEHATDLYLHNKYRWYSMKFYHHPLLEDIRYVWRLEPDVNLYCDINYDVFHFMKEYNKIYGFVVSIYNHPEAIRNLWGDTRNYARDHPEYLNFDGSYGWIKDNVQKPNNFILCGYSTCHFWSAFEIIDLNFLRSDVYEGYVKHLDSMKGFYFQFWGDGPVRSLALSLFVDKRQIHWFRDIGFYKMPFSNCPNSDKCGEKCTPGAFTPRENLALENCMANWIKYSMDDDLLQLY